MVTGNGTIYLRIKKIWENFVIHFSTAHRDIKKSEELVVTETPFRTANLDQEVIVDVQEALNPTEDNEAKVDYLPLKSNYFDKRVDCRCGYGQGYGFKYSEEK